MSYIDAERNFKVSESELRYLVRCRCQLEALEAGGVDNWTWYGESMHNYVRDYFDDELPNEDPCIEDVVEDVMKKYKEE